MHIYLANNHWFVHRLHKVHNDFQSLYSLVSNVLSGFLKVLLSCVLYRFAWELDNRLAHKMGIYPSLLKQNQFLTLHVFRLKKYCTKYRQGTILFVLPIYLARFLVKQWVLKENYRQTNILEDFDTHCYRWDIRDTSGVEEIGIDDCIAKQRNKYRG